MLFLKSYSNPKHFSFFVFDFNVSNKIFSASTRQLNFQEFSNPPLPHSLIFQEFSNPPIRPLLLGTQGEDGKNEVTFGRVSYICFSCSSDTSIYHSVLHLELLIVWKYTKTEKGAQITFMGTRYRMKSRLPTCARFGN